MKPADAEKLVDISSIQVDPNLPYAERAKSYLSQIVNPYRYLDHGFTVTCSFAGECSLEGSVPPIKKNKREKSGRGIKASIVMSLNLSPPNKKKSSLKIQQQRGSPRIAVFQRMMQNKLLPMNYRETITRI